MEEEPAVAEMKQREQQLAQAQARPRHWNDLTADQIRDLEKDADQLYLQGDYSAAAELKEHILDWHKNTWAPKILDWPPPQRSWSALQTLGLYGKAEQHTNSL